MNVIFNLNFNFNRYHNKLLMYRCMTTDINKSDNNKYKNFKFWDSRSVEFSWNTIIHCSSQDLPFNQAKHMDLNTQINAIGKVDSNHLGVNINKQVDSTWMLINHLLFNVVDKRKVKSNWNLTGSLSNTALTALLKSKYWLLRVNVFSSSPELNTEVAIMQFISRGTRLLGNFLNEGLRRQVGGKHVQITDIMVSSPEVEKEFPQNYMMFTYNRRQFSYHVNGVDTLLWGRSRGIKIYDYLRTKLLCLTNDQICQVCKFLLSK